MPSLPWTAPRGVDAVVTEWLESGAVRRCLAAERVIGATEARYAPIPSALAPGLRRALAGRGITELYAHQAEAVEAALARRHVVVATPTASGKSLCFHLPVLQALAEDASARALYLYPTKALSRDQEHDLRALVGEAELGIPAVVFDGDTPGDARRAARERGRVLITNPDMLHAGLLPNHPKWAALFQGLRYVVLDELHTYRGVFGSHMAHVIARLRRVARFHGSDPTFIMATATIGNPREHAARLIGSPPEGLALVERSGAPRSARRFFLYNPPVVNQELGIRASTLKQAVSLTASLVRARVPTLLFGPSRNSVETMLKYLRAEVGDVAGPDAIMGYRGGYLPEARRRVEQGLRDGEILCVVATNALELGIDVGELDAVVCAGYPGSVAGTWQRFGRAGRRGATSIALLVCSSDPLDQFLAREPRWLLERDAEEARIDPANLEILIQHLKCAAFEAPFELTAPGARPARPELAEGEHYGALDAAATRDALEYLGGHGLIHESGGRYHWAGEAFPASSVSLRSVGWDNFVIIELESARTLAELDWRAAHTMLHEQAIYQHDAEQYQVERLDYENHKAFVRKVAPDYFTTALTYRTVEVIDRAKGAPFGPAALGFGDVKVVEKVTGYKKVKFFTHENAGYGDVHLPEMQMHTTSFWLTLPEALVESLGATRAAVIEGLRGLGAALETVSALALMIDPRDLNRTLGDGDGDAGGASPRPAGRDPLGGRTGGFEPTVFLFDAMPGGVGLAERIYERAGELIGRARGLIGGCACASGCPACVGPEAEGGAARKQLALAVADAVLGGEPSRVAAAPALDSRALA
ncbi:MAG: DEAD/DEAH box helicase [Sorangiineae bacterium]|nr:DEAD/DEAH box helicase [Polyangiaceae bacterium]MEB2323949.1 DEAD/DEAH box helicase [Sorangiineae bacterium]